jgi:hypothetical protein
VTAPVTIVSCVYGSSHDRFVDEWAEAVSHLDPAPADVIVASDRDRQIPGASVMYSRCPWDHPQAFYLQMAAMVAGTDWVWIVDIDDLPFTDGLAGLDEVEEDVWQLGYLSSEGHQHLPPQADRGGLSEPERKSFLRGQHVPHRDLRSVRRLHRCRVSGLVAVAADGPHRRDVQSV